MWSWSAPGSAGSRPFTDLPARRLRSRSSIDATTIVSAASLSGGDGVARALGDRLADPASLSPALGRHNAAGVRGSPSTSKLASFASMTARRFATTRSCSRPARGTPISAMTTWEPFAPGLKTLEDATTIRGRILLAFERAERESDEQKRAALMTFVIVGGGPTGVELAGTIAELARGTLPHGLPPYRHADGAHRAGRGRSARPSGFRGGPVDYAQALAGAAGRRGRARPARLRMPCRRRRVRRRTARGSDDHLGRWRPVLASGAMARRASRPRWPSQGLNPT